MFKFGKGSVEILDTVNEYLVIAAKATIAESKIDISIPKWGGLRTANYQYELYKKKWSKADGTVKKSNHQLTDVKGKSKALDLCAYHEGKQNWNKERLVYIAVLMIKNFEALKEKGLIPKDVYVHWGGYWKNKEDGLGWDLPHFQIGTSNQTIFV